jgi:multiple sugar transport system ATP-binding protein
MNFIPGVLREGHPDRALVQLTTGELIEVRVDARALPVGQAVSVGLRPEHAELGTGVQHVIREVQWQERLGEATYLYLHAGEGQSPLVVKAPGHVHADAGQRIALALPPAALHLFDAQGQALERCVPSADLHLVSAA